MLESRPEDAQVLMHWQNLKQLEAEYIWSNMENFWNGPIGERSISPVEVLGVKGNADKENNIHYIHFSWENFAADFLTYWGYNLYSSWNGCQARLGEKSQKRIRIVYNRTRRVFTFFFFFFVIRNSKLYTVQ